MSVRSFHMNTEVCEQMQTELRRTEGDSEFTFTVFTPTRNRAHTLPVVYESLSRQTFRDFEWLVIDNDSTDTTADLVSRWQSEATFSIRYIRQPNRGVQVSWNRAAVEAHGRFMVVLPSDDTCFPEALERLKCHWDSIPKERQPEFSAVTGLCVDEHGRQVGDRFPFDPTDSDSLEIRFRYKVHGEKWGFQKVSVMREHPLPLIPGYRGYIPESLMWDAISRRYKTRYVNEPLRVITLDDRSSLSRPANPADNAPGGVLETEALLREDLRWFVFAPFQFLARAAKFARCGFHINRSIAAQWRRLPRPGARALWIVALPLGWLAYRIERAGLRGSSRPRRQASRDGATR